MPLTYTTFSAAQQLKLQTAEKHQQLEELMLPCLISIAHKQHYIQLLHAFYGYFKPVEDAVAPFVEESLLPDWPTRRKADVILLDLAAIDQTNILPNLATNLPCIGTLPQALGALYVLEGSTLGGRGITKMLLKNERAGLQPEHLQFFAGYGERTGLMWTHFVNVLNSFCFSEAEMEQMVQSANDTFYFFKTWLEETLLKDEH